MPKRAEAVILAEDVCPHGLTLINSTTRVEGRVEFKIPYMPHYNTLTKTGEANFSRIPDALAELLDNSIQVHRAKGRSAVHLHDVKQASFGHVNILLHV